MPEVTIKSDTIISNIENHFKISAGPGAGKTHWLVNHIKNVLHNSKRLSKCRKIACITYSNIAVETVLSRLGSSADQVEVSTIHSFLYKHLIKPYIHFIANEYGVKTSALDGHEEHVVSNSKLLFWLENHSHKDSLAPPFNYNQLTKLPQNRNALSNWLLSINYQLNACNTIFLTCDKTKAAHFDKTRTTINQKTLLLLESDLLEYKKLYWAEGLLHHDDILFFSFLLIQKFPYTLKILRAKFPYFFIDEFQDINSIQLHIIKQIVSNETVCGVIGDSAQSIYGFQGGNPQLFNSFELTDLRKYIIENNRRSSIEIVDFLNIIRTDLKQKTDNGNTQLPLILVGDMILALEEAGKNCSLEDVYSLSRKNITSNALKNGINSTNLNNNLLDDLKSVDSNLFRSQITISCIKSTELAKEKKYKEAIKELEKVFRHTDEFAVRKQKSLKILSILVKSHASIEKMSLFDFSNFLRQNISTNLAQVSGGNIKPFYEKYTYKQIALCVNIVEDLSQHKTIHKAKGSEFDNVILVLSDEKDLSFILEPKLNDNNNTGEEHRINYVAVSRAKKRLFINVPTLSDDNINKLQKKISIQVL
jgi:DNA helicase-2/ATP-dependent DNA helicase PcrA